MEALAPTPDEAMAGLRMCKTVAGADGELAPGEISLLLAAGSALGIDCDPSDLRPVMPDEVASAILSPALRERALQAALLTALADGEVADAEVSSVEAFAAALGVDEPRVRNLRQLAEGHVRRMWLDLARRSFAKPVFEDALRERGLSGVWSIVAPMIGLGGDPDLARRFNDLGRLPDGTLGRAYWRFVVDNDLGFPGEGIVAAEGVWHDLTHVLAGYGTDPTGEVQVVSFIAGYRKEDPFFWLFTIALQFHLGIRVSPYSPPARGYFDPNLVISALRRGMAVNRDLSVGWDYADDLVLPVEDVRRKYGVPPA